MRNKNCIMVRKYGHPFLADNEDIKELLGLRPRQKLPKEGIAPRKISGITVWVNPLPERLPGKWRKRSTHRVMAKCPACQREMSVGRLAQHKCLPA